MDTAPDSAPPSGRGEYANSFSRDWMVVHTRIEIFLRRERAHELAHAFVHVARAGAPGDGLVVILPVEAIYHIRTGEVATAGELGGAECIACQEPNEYHEDSRETAPR